MSQTDDVPHVNEAPKPQHKPTHAHNHITVRFFIYTAGENTSSNPQNMSKKCKTTLDSLE